MTPLIFVNLVFNVPGILPIKLPLQGIVYNVFTNAVQLIFISDNMFVIISLPDGDSAGVPNFVEAFGRNSLECSYQTT